MILQRSAFFSFFWQSVALHDFRRISIPLSEKWTIVSTRIYQHLPIYYNRKDQELKYSSVFFHFQNFQLKFNRI